MAIEAGLTQEAFVPVRTRMRRAMSLKAASALLDLSGDCSASRGPRSRRGKQSPLRIACPKRSWMGRRGLRSEFQIRHAGRGYSSTAGARCWSCPTAISIGLAMVSRAWCPGIGKLRPSAGRRFLPNSPSSFRGEIEEGDVSRNVVHITPSRCRLSGLSARSFSANNALVHGVALMA